VRYVLGPHGVVDGVLPRPNVRLGRLDHLRVLEELPGEEQDREDGHVDVRREEVRRREHPRLARSLLDEDVEAVEDDDDGEEAQREPGRVRLELALEDERVAVDVLREQRLAEAQIRDADANPGEQLRDGDEVLEPEEHLLRAGRARQVRQQRDDGGQRDAVVGDAGLGAREEDLGRLPVLGDAEEVARAGVQEGVGGGGGRGQDDGVDDAVEALDAGERDGDDPGGREGAWTS